MERTICVGCGAEGFTASPGLAPCQHCGATDAITERDNDAAIAALALMDARKRERSRNDAAREILPGRYRY